jgi:major type 1 subunit fimbrin (pilin)
VPFHALVPEYRSLPRIIKSGRRNPFIHSFFIFRGISNIMQKNIHISLLAALALAAAAAHASDGTIAITGNVTSSTCTVKGDGSGGNVSVTLPKIATSTLAAATDTGGFKPIIISLSGCGDSAGVVKAGFEPGPNVDPVSGRLNISSSADAAKNVQLQLRNSDGSVIRVGDESTVAGVGLVDGAARLDYAVGYYATGQATAGSVNSSVTYSIVYP